MWAWQSRAHTPLLEKVPDGVQRTHGGLRVAGAAHRPEDRQRPWVVAPTAAGVISLTDQVNRRPLNIRYGRGVHEAIALLRDHAGR